MAYTLLVYPDNYGGNNKSYRPYNLYFLNLDKALTCKAFLGKGRILEGIQLDLFKQITIKE